MCNTSERLGDTVVIKVRGSCNREEIECQVTDKGNTVER